MAMTMFKRPIGRRVAGVVIAAALLMLGLAAPAFAAAPTITSFTPSSGPGGATGCVVTIIGTNLNTPAVSVVTFPTLAVATTFSVVSDTEIRATVPVTASGTGTIAVTNASGTGASASSFTVATPGTCSPTITSFSPTSGPVGTGVNIFGTNLLGASAVKFFNNKSATFAEVSSTQINAFVPSGATTGVITVTTGVSTATSASSFTVWTGAAPTITSFTPTTGPVGTSVTITGTNFTGATSVTFNNVNAPGFTVNGAGTQITVSVPTGATTGPIKVTTPGGTATSSSNFTVSASHSRGVTLSLVKHLVARGLVSVGDGFAQCASNVPVKIQHLVSGHWRNVATATTTSSGSYRKRIRDRPGKYRVRVTRVVLGGGTDICGRDTSPTRTNELGPTAS